MKHFHQLSFTIVALTILFSSCKPLSDSTASSVAPVTSRFVPNAVIYKTKMDYSQYVPVNLDATKSRIVSYPHPTDLTKNSTPLKLINDWWLDRRGITINSVFTSFTYDDYSKLSKAPNIRILQERIIDDDPFIAILQLPITAHEAATDTAKCNQIIRTAIQSCTRVYPSEQ